MKQEILTDSFGVWRLFQNVECHACGEIVPLAVRSKRGNHHLTLPPGIAVESTILKQHGNTLGLSCGCYAKFHRQVAHIFDSMKLRVKNGDQLPPERMRD